MHEAFESKYISRSPIISDSSFLFSNFDIQWNDFGMRII